MALHSFKLLITSLVLIGSLNAALLASRNDEPNYKDYAKMARYLVHRLGIN